MEDLIKFLIEPLVSDIKKIKIERKQDGDLTSYFAYIPKDEIAKVIGKNGKMIKSIKSLVKIRSIKENIATSFEVEEA